MYRYDLVEDCRYIYPHNTRRLFGWPRLSEGAGGGVVSGSGTAERGSTGTDFSHLRPCLNGGLAGGGLAGVIQSAHVFYTSRNPCHDAQQQFVKHLFHNQKISFENDLLRFFSI